ncbi:GAF domain-containing protein [Blastococcus jejuensis]|uniref:GAF domain-containing protein n=1 Tax=Blastococcus jejuensis TaxID=351224 RepID=A0ABP6PB32_9ACTN
MTIAARFETALAGAAGPEVEGPELLPVRLARACADVLDVDGAAISLVDATAQRVPLGASHRDVEVAEHLQFTVGEGPCMLALSTRQPVFAVEEDLRRRWPVFADLLLAQTPFRAVVTLPLQPALAGAAALALFFEDDRRVPDLDVFESLAVGELVTAALGDATVWSEWSPGEGPGWMHGPTPQRRAAVWEAMGKVGVELGVGATTALDLMRGAAYAAGGTVDDVAADLLAGRLTPRDLGDRDQGVT